MDLHINTKFEVGQEVYHIESSRKVVEGCVDMYIKKFQNAYLKITGQFNVPVALYDLEKELKRADENCSIVNLIDKLLNEFDMKFNIELLMFPSWATKKKIYQINNEYYTHIRIKRNLIR